MITDIILAILYLSVSCESLIAQSVSLWKILKWRFHDGEDQRRVHYGMLRTAICRVIAASIYVGVGFVAIFIPRIWPVVAWIVFSLIQLMWQANAFADVHLRGNIFMARSLGVRSARYRKTKIVDDGTHIDS
jgi:predicted membrane protein